MGQVLTLEPVVLNYFERLTRAMEVLAADPRTLFVGQGVGNAGTSMSDSFVAVPDHKRLEFPVAEDFQAGFCIGLALQGKIPVCVFPRWNFMLCAANQIINHLDRLPLYSDYRPKVIIRVATPSKHPFNPGPQHDDDLSNAFDAMLRTTRVVRLHSADTIVQAYTEALKRPQSTVLVEYTDHYRNERGNAKH